MIGLKTLQGNHFRMATEGGKQIWYWESTPGSQCGRTIQWRYEVQHGDSVRQDAGTCPQGYQWAEMMIFGDPVKQ